MIYRVRTMLVALCVLVTSSASAQTSQPTKPLPEPLPAVRVGDTAKNLKVLPPWTMRQCRIGTAKALKLRGVYDMDGALKLKKTDADCALWRDSQTNLKAQNVTLGGLVEHLEKSAKLAAEQQVRSDARIAELVTQVKEEIELKNKYKYKPNYNWLYIGIGAAVAVAGVGFGAGVWLAK